MTHAHEDIKAHRYYWEYLKRFGSESYETLRRDFLLSVLVAAVSCLFRLGNRTYLDDAFLFFESTACVYGLFVLKHLAHVALLLFRERAHPENGGIHFIEKRYGIFGIALLIAMVSGISYSAYRVLLQKLPSFVANWPKPAPPIEIQVTKYVHSNGTSNTSTPQPVAGPIAAPNNQNAPPQAPAPVTPLDRIVQENRALATPDRNRLSDELFAADRFLKQSQAVGYRFNTELGKLNGDRATGALSKNVAEHIQALQSMDTAAWDQYHGLQKFQSDYQYFDHQNEYIFGDNPFNAGEGLVLNAIEGLMNELTRWSKITNRDQGDVLALEGDFQQNYQIDLNQFFRWADLSRKRIDQMRQSLDPNRTVEPLPTGAVAPAPAMFTVNRT